MQGKTALITGAARGMGYVTAKALAAKGAHIILVDWQGELGHRACDEINRHGCGSAEFIYCNLAEIDEVKQLGETVAQRHDTLDVLINNAGITYPQRQENSAGIEMHFAVCHLGHFLLTNLLLDLLKQAPTARIIFVSSEGHKACKGLDFNDINNVAIWKSSPVNHGAAFMAYARAKLANIYTMLDLHAQLKGSTVTVNALSPGYFVNTGIHREMRGVFKWGAKLVFGLAGLFGLNTAVKGARTHIWLASSDDATELSGLYFQHGRVKSVSPYAHDTDARERLRTYSLQLLQTNST